MKNTKHTKYVAVVLLVLFLITSLISCSTHVHTTSSGKIPPGQAKKNVG
ncbi:hypothetical protein [Flavobacterium agrisoli]|nr:hypothetical protein [Flavobacterium agrisoli]